MLVSTSGFSDGVSFIIAFVMNILAKIFVIDFMAIFTFYGGVSFLGKLYLG